MKEYAVYMVTNKYHSVLYIGMTSDIERRTYEHREHLIQGFSGKYNCTKLVYVEFCSDVYDALNREKQLKRWIRAKKDALINKFNPEWRDLIYDCF